MTTVHLAAIWETVRLAAIWETVRLVAAWETVRLEAAWEAVRQVAVAGGPIPQVDPALVAAPLAAVQTATATSAVAAKVPGCAPRS